MKYTVEKTEFGIVIKNDIPLSDLDALISTWEGMEGGEEMVVSSEVARMLDAVIAIAWNPQDLKKWVMKLRGKKADDAQVVEMLAGSNND